MDDELRNKLMITQLGKPATSIIRNQETKIIELQSEIDKLKNQALVSQRSNEILNGEKSALQNKISEVIESRKDYIKSNQELNRVVDHYKWKYHNAEPMYYEDRDSILVELLELLNVNDDLVSDELLNKIDEIFERYTTGTYRNYN